MNKIATHPVVLTSRRLSLRPLKVEDAARLARITNDPLVTRNLLKPQCLLRSLTHEN